MSHSTATISPLRQRMIDDMTQRRLKPGTQRSHILGVRRLATFLGRSPATATAEDLRRFHVVFTLPAAIADYRALSSTYAQRFIDS